MFFISKFRLLENEFSSEVSSVYPQLPAELRVLCRYEDRYHLTDIALLLSFDALQDFQFVVAG